MKRSMGRGSRIARRRSRIGRRMEMRVRKEVVEGDR